MTDFSFRQSSPLIKSLVFLVIVILMMLLGIFIAVLIGIFGYQLDLMDIPSILQNSGAEAGFLKWSQLATAVCVFIGSPLIYAALQTTDLRDYFQLRSYKPASLSALAIFGFLLLGPLLSQLVEWSEAMGWTTNQDTTELMQAMLSGSGFMGLLVNLFIIALVPALGEELFFRAVIQKGLINATRIPWLGIVLSALIFSFFHMEMNLFLARWVMGIFLGVLFYTSRSLWLPILAHFVNNASVVILYFLYENNSSLVKTNPLEDDLHQQSWLVGLSAILLILMIQQAFAHRKIIQNTWSQLYLNV